LESGVSCSFRVVSHALIGCFLGHPSTLWSFDLQYRQRLLLIQCLCSLSFNFPSLPNLSKSSTHGVDGDGDLAMEDDDLGGLGNSKRARSVADLSMTGDECHIPEI